MIFVPRFIWHWHLKSDSGDTFGNEIWRYRLCLCNRIFYVYRNGLVMNWYYSSVTGLQIKEFWKQIIKISFRIMFCCIIGYFINIMTMSGSNTVFVIKMIGYTILYSGVIYFTSMNREEKNKICQLLRREM